MLAEQSGEVPETCQCPDDTMTKLIVEGYLTLDLPSFVVFLQCDIYCRSLECGFCPDPQRKEEGQRSGPHGPGGRRQRPRSDSCGWHGRHLRHHLPRSRQVCASGLTSSQFDQWQNYIQPLIFWCLFSGLSMLVPSRSTPFSLTAFSQVLPFLVSTVPRLRPWWWPTPSHRRRRWRRAPKYRYIVWGWRMYQSNWGWTHVQFFSLFFLRSLTSPWSWQRPLGEPTTANQCLTSLATSPCKVQNKANPAAPLCFYCQATHLGSCRYKSFRKSLKISLVVFDKTHVTVSRSHPHICQTFSTWSESLLHSRKTKFVFIHFPHFFLFCQH